jgi:hypothetical protein
MTALVAVAAVVLLAACSGDDGGAESGLEVAEEILEQQRDGEIEIETDGEITVEGEDGGDSFSLGGDVPDDFPEVVPLPQGGVVVTSTGSGDGPNRSWSVAYTGLDPNSVAGYRDTIVGDGFEIENSFSDDQGGVSAFVATGHGYVVAVGGSADGFILTVTRSF